MRPGLFIFDMIGTTIEPSDAIPDAFRSALSRAGLQLSDDEIASVRGKSKREAISELVKGQRGGKMASAERESIYADFMARLTDHYGSGNVRSIHMAAETLNWCRSVEAKVALTTGFDRAVADLLINSLDWTSKFDTLVCNDDVAAGRPAPYLILEAMRRTGVESLLQVASVGDTVSDLQAGVNAGIRWNFAVLTGAHDRSTLSRVDGAIILDRIAELQEYRW